MFLGKISFGVYCVHYPILCSFTANLVRAAKNNGISESGILVMAILVTTVITIAFARVFTYIEKIIKGHILNKI